MVLERRILAKDNDGSGHLLVTMARSLSMVGSTLVGPTALAKAESCG